MTSHRSPIPPSRRCGGLSLIELMVGLAISMVLTIGLLSLVAGSSRAFKVQDDFARLQENGTAALNFIGNDIRMAGFYGMAADTGAVSAAGGVATDNDCGSAANPPANNWALEAIVPISGFGNLTPASVSDTLPCIQRSNFVAGPVLTLRSAVGYRIPDPDNDGNLDDAALDPATIYVQSDPNTGVLFSGGDFAALKAAGTSRMLTNNVDAPIYEYQAHVYYLRPCSRPAKGATCGGGDDGGRPIPTLVRQELNGSAMQEVPLVEGVERINFSYGVDTNSNGVADRYKAAPAAAEWANVVAVRVSVLVRTITPTAGHDDSGKSYNLGDGVVFACAADCNYKRHVFTQTFQVRNTAQRRGA